VGEVVRGVGEERGRQRGDEMGRRGKGAKGRGQKGRRGEIEEGGFGQGPVTVSVYARVYVGGPFQSFF